MLCSSCSAHIKPIVALDIDGTLGDYHGHFLRFAEQYLDLDYSRAGHHYDAILPFSTWVMSRFGITLEEYRATKLAYRQGGQKRSMPIFEGAQALCWSIRDAGAELWLTTTRPYLSLDNVVPDTVFWLKRYEIEYDGMLFDDDKYAKLRGQVDPERVVAVFDDVPELVEAANREFPGRGWLVKGDWNHGVRARLNCDLDSAADIATNAIWTWRGQHDG